MATRRFESGLTYAMTFSCPHGTKAKKYTLEGVHADKWFKVCAECGVKVNWSPKLKAWLSDADWKEYRNVGRKLAGLDPE